MATLLSRSCASIASLPVTDSPSTSASKHFGLTVAFGPGSEFGFENLLQIFALLPLNPQTDPTKVRHMLGFGYDATCPRKTR